MNLEVVPVMSSCGVRKDQSGSDGGQFFFGSVEAQNLSSISQFLFLLD